MSTPQWQTKVTPAQLAFLAIYNPSLGPTDDTFRDQLVFYYSRTAIEVRVAAKKNARIDSAGGDALRAEENEKLRQIGLAQGMVDFAKSFSSGKPVDSIETEKSRIVVHELEKGWWILASIDLTRLPSISQSSSAQSKTSVETKAAKPSVEYSSREVSPPALLIEQLLQAHYIFSLHHGPSLSDLFVRLTRDKFCNTLDRFWTRFARSWDVLLHGNPAVDVFSGVKLASGGELGFGVGEEEWGSGEREVLEDLARRTEGLVDLFVARFGEPASIEERKRPELGEEGVPWMGSGSQPLASDGLIFGGIGAVQRHSLRDVSLWMRQIYTYGEQAYGVKDNPLRERRKRRRRTPSRQPRTANGDLKASENAERGDLRRTTGRRRAAEHEATDNKSDVELPLESRPEIDSRTPSHDPTTTTEEIPTPVIDETQPGIPPPIVSGAEQNIRKSARQTGPEAEQDESGNAEAVDEPTNALGIPDQYMKYLTFGLSTLGKPKVPSTSRRMSGTSAKEPTTRTKAGGSKSSKAIRPIVNEEDEPPPSMTQVEPMPEGEAIRSKLATQIRQENRGQFVIGLKGNLLELDELSSDDDQTENISDEGDFGLEADGSRIVLRTVQVEVVPRDDNEETSGNEGSLARTDESLMNNYKRLRVVLYVHRPFMYCFLFRDRTSSLQLIQFYKSLHRNLVPIHKPLLSSTSVEKVTQRIENSHTLLSEDDGSLSERDANKTKPQSKRSNSSPIYSLIYDPRRLTLHTSILNIPEPGTPAAEGIFTGILKPSEAPAWTRIEALNVHSQILNTLVSVKNSRSELERMSRTSRGWWVVWMKVPPSGAFSIKDNDDEATTRADGGSSMHALRSNKSDANSKVDVKDDEDLHRVAFLVRKASAASPAPNPTSSGSRAVSSMLEVMSLGMAGREEDTTGAENDGWGPGALGGGIGIDCRKYVEGLLSLNR